MDQFLLDNTPLYRALVNRFKPAPRGTEGKTETTNASVVVSARVRPLLDEDIAAGFPNAIFPRPMQTGVVDIHNLYNHPKGRPVLKSFTYEVDRLFDSETTTDQIYNNLVEDLVPFACNGGIGTLFTYGQTGSGKTFTVSQLGKLVAESLMGEGKDSKRQVGLTVVDLAGNAASDLLNSRKPVSILEDSFGVTQLAGASEQLVQTRGELVDLLDRAASFRRTAPTVKNDASSRSHGICRLRVHNKSTRSDGLIYLIDLAGSEAARDVAVHGADRMRETREINVSLSVLKDCIRGKAQSDLLGLSQGPKSKQRKPYVPFRQSALTKVLRHVFDPAETRPCKTVVIMCLNPSLADVEQSKNTLRYAEMLRVAAPTAGRTKSSPMNPIQVNSQCPSDAPKAPAPNSLKPIKPHSTIAKVGATARSSSRDLEPTDISKPFKERIRPGMVISWKQPLGHGSVPSTGDGRLAIILCPAGAIQGGSGSIPDDLMAPTENGRTEEKANRTDSQKYLCALVTPAPMTKAYEVNLWRQTIIDIGVMDREILLEYDPETRYYFICG
ncbi:P-loop containing nucleoside triphosphate hydrolase protein [Aspergillus ambiguus]|uniref:P-loop containing nucleoside triphosphate hydrolase protein n=1 Tax=Aspergillus ambiguus TaxID=176160 RepID=UPI003CCD7BC5